MITYNSDGVKMPKIRKRDTSAWIKAVAATYGRKVGDVLLHVRQRRENP